MKTGYERVKKGEKYYYANIFNEARTYTEQEVASDDKIYNTANYYSDKTVAENNARADELMRKLRRFAVEHNEHELDWKKVEQFKYHINYNNVLQEIYVECNDNLRRFGQIYFSSEEIAKQAIEEFKDDLLWYFTEYCDHVVEAKTIECDCCSNADKLQAMKVLGFKMCPYCCKELEGE